MSASSQGERSSRKQIASRRTGMQDAGRPEDPGPHVIVFICFPMPEHPHSALEKYSLRTTLYENLH